MQTTEESCSNQKSLDGYPDVRKCQRRDRTIFLEIHSLKAEAIREAIAYPITLVRRLMQGAIALLTQSSPTQHRHNILIETHIFPVSCLS
jgi:hypothetical protein